MTIEAEVIGIFVVGLFTVIAGLTGALYFVANSIKAVTKTNVELNNELQENSRDRIAFRQEIVHLEESVRSLRAALDDANVAIKELRALNQTLTDMLGKVREDLSDATNRISVLNREALEMKGTIRELTSALTRAQNRTTDLESREKDLTAQLTAAYERIAALEKAGELKDEEIKELKARVNELETALKKARDERTQLEHERDELQKQLNAILKYNQDEEKTDGK